MQKITIIIWPLLEFLSRQDSNEVKAVASSSHASFSPRVYTFMVPDPPLPCSAHFFADWLDNSALFFFVKECLFLSLLKQEPCSKYSSCLRNRQRNGGKRLEQRALKNLKMECFNPGSRLFSPGDKNKIIPVVRDLFTESFRLGKPG